MTETKTARSFANPVLQKLQNVIRQETESTTATYSGIAAKTAFFLVMAVVGAALFICLHPVWLANGTAIEDRKSTRQNSSHNTTSRMPSSA